MKTVNVTPKGLQTEQGRERCYACLADFENALRDLGSLIRQTGAMETLREATRQLGFDEFDFELLEEYSKKCDEAQEDYLSAVCGRWEGE